MSCLAGALCALSLIPEVPVERFVNFGGTNHWVYDNGTATAGNTNDNWYLPALNLRSTVATMEHDLALVHQQMQALRASGQTAYVIPIWNKNLAFDRKAPIDGLADGVWGNVIDHSASVMLAQHRTNLQQLVTWAVELGFERIVVRFFYNGDQDTWVKWDSAAYEVARSFIFDAREASEEAFQLAWGKRKAPSYPVLLFDLGAEQGGIDQGMMALFMQHLWIDYTSSYGVDDTVGFSFAWAPGRFTTQLGWLSATGVLPKRWAFDIYGDMQGTLGQIQDEMGPLRNQPIDVMETYFNDPGTAGELDAALDAMPLLNIDSLMQWAVASGETHFTPSAVVAQSTPTTFTSYASFLPSRRLYMTSDDADVMGFSNTTCGTGVLPCNVDLYWGTPPTGQLVGIYVHSAAGTGRIKCEPVAGLQPLDWVQPAYEYDFEAYHFSGGCPLPSALAGYTPVARGHIQF